MGLPTLSPRPPPGSVVAATCGRAAVSGGVPAVSSGRAAYGAARPPGGAPESGSVTRARVPPPGRGVSTRAASAP